MLGIQIEGHQCPNILAIQMVENKESIRVKKKNSNKYIWATSTQNNH
jgi:hypothetical protein